jgi:hypothetical protein
LVEWGGGVGGGGGDWCQDGSVRDRMGCRWRWKMTRSELYYLYNMRYVLLRKSLLY